jgi:hypothetical protein
MQCSPSAQQAGKELPAVEAYPDIAPESKNAVAVRPLEQRRCLDARKRMTWWRNPNARGIAEPDPRTVERGKRPRRALHSPCPNSRLRVRRERELTPRLNQVARLDQQLAYLATRVLDPEPLRAAAVELHAAYAGRRWMMPDPNWETRDYERATPEYLPSRSRQQATWFLRAYTDAAQLITFWELQLRRDWQARWAGLRGARLPRPTAMHELIPAALAGHAAPTPAPPPEKKNDHPQVPDDRKDIRTSEPKPAWKETADRIARRAGFTPADATPDEAM